MNRFLAHIADYVAELEARLRNDAGYFTEKDRRISSLERQLRYWKNLQRLSEREVDSLKRSWSYRVGRVVISPASALKQLRAGLRRALRRRAADGGALGPEPSRGAEQRAGWAETHRRLTTRPRFSVVLPVFDTPPGVLVEALDSVRAQIYGEWELCIADDGSSNPRTREVLEEFRSAHPARVRMVRLEENRGIASASNAAARLARGAFLAFLDHDDLLAPDALLEMAARIGQVPEADLIYSDEDKLEPGGLRVEPFHKPDFSPELFLCSNYLCHLTVMRRSVFEAVGGFRAGFDGSQDYDLFLRASEIARRIEHVPKILYHWRKTPGSAAADERAKGGPWRQSSRKALRAAVERRGWAASVENGIVPGTHRVRFEVDPRARVCVIVPTRDRVDLLRRCVDSIHRHTPASRHEILVVSNGSVERETYTYLEQAERDGLLRTERYDEPFNFAAINNVAARSCDAPYLLFLNNDVEVHGDGWLDAMLEHAGRRAVGVVGAKLLYPDHTVQHAGIALGVMGVAGHSHRGLSEGQHGYFGLADAVRNCSAVTGACLLTRRDVFEEVGGFSEEFAVAFNDVDYCLKVTQAGYRVVYTPYARLVHQESLTRGRDDLRDRSARFRSEVARMVARWGEQLFRDPYYNENLTLWREDQGPKAPGEDERLEEFLAPFGLSLSQLRAPDRLPALVPAEQAHRDVALLSASRSDYKPVWNELAATEEQAKLHVIGSTDEAALAEEACRTLSVLELTVGIRPSDVVLEIGCGVGRLGAVVAPACKEWIGCDVSRRMLEHAARRLSRCDNVRLVEVSGFDLEPIAGESIDVVFSTVVFMHLDEWDRHGYVLEAQRVLRPGGRIYIDNVNLRSDEGWRVFEAHRAIPPDRRPAHITRTSTPQELRTYVERAGFGEIHCRESGLWTQCWAVK